MADPLALAKRLIALRARIVANFNAGHWEEVGLLSGQSKIINGHDRLLRSLSWHDEDYDGNVLTVLRQIADHDVRALKVIEDYLDERFPGEEKTEYVSAKPAERKITFAPNVFRIPEGSLEPDLVAVMMPFSPEFKPVYEAMKRACTANFLRCMRVDDMWQDSVIVQDIFSLIFRAQVVVVDFSRKNPNVMYETGIAHTLGKHVVPVAQSIDDVPFDMRHHRTLLYLANGEGLQRLEHDLAAKLNQFRGGGGPPIFNLGFSS
jgi:hypothetical protein